MHIYYEYFSIIFKMSILCIVIISEAKNWKLNTIYNLIKILDI